MNQQSFRYYIPGIIFLTPVYMIACWITINYFTDSDIRIFVLVGGITVFPAIAWPIGWFLYHSYTVLRLSITGGRYEDKEFVKLVKEETKPFYNPRNKKIIIDFSHVSTIGSWLKLEPEVFRKIFYPKYKKKKFYTDIKSRGINTPYNEQYADLVTMNYIGRPYLKSISSIRYGLESGIYTLILGILYALSFYFIWNYHHETSINSGLYYISIVVLTILTIFILSTLIIRWRQADKEYDSRLILHVVSALNSHHLKINSFYKSVSEENLKKLNNLKVNNRSYAVLQLDDSLLEGNSQKALLGWLINRKKIKNLSINEYLDLLKDDNNNSLQTINTLLSNLPKSLLKNETKELFKSSEKYIELEKNKILKPLPNENLLSILFFLKSKGIKIFALSSSNKIVADLFCWEYFGIPASNVIAANLNEKNIITSSKNKYNELLKSSNTNPIITSCSNSWDDFLLDDLENKNYTILTKNQNDQYLKSKGKKSTSDKIIKI